MSEGSAGIVQTKYYTFAHPPDELELENGERLGPITLAYETYGDLNADKSNAILICHALSGDAHVAGYHSPDDRKPGWWDDCVGPGKAFDTDKYFVICANVPGGCKGTTGPSSIDPKTGSPYGLSFPVVTVADMVNTQRHLIDHLGIDQLLTVVGGSMGGMQALQWTIAYPHRVRSAIPLATTARLSPQSIALNEVGRQAIYKDVHWNNGDYYDKESKPHAGLSLARMIGHITYLSDTSMQYKFGRRLQHAERYGYNFKTEFAVESYLKYHGDNFIRRFDANSYLYITKAQDYFDLANGHGSLTERFEGVTAKFLVVSFMSDWLFPSYQSKEIVSALMANGVDVTYVDIDSPYGHDAFLLEVERLTDLMSDFLKNICVTEGVAIP